MIIRCVCRDGVLETRGVIRTREYVALQEGLGKDVAVRVNMSTITLTHCTPALFVHLHLYKVTSFSRQWFYDTNAVESC